MLASRQSVAAVAKTPHFEQPPTSSPRSPHCQNAMMVDSRNEVWANTTIGWEHDDFCDSWQVVTACLSNHGKSPLDVGLEDIKPGKSIMCDVVTNMNQRGLTTSSHHPY